MRPIHRACRQGRHLHGALSHVDSVNDGPALQLKHTRVPPRKRARHAPSQTQKRRLVTGGARQRRYSVSSSTSIDKSGLTRSDHSQSEVDEGSSSGMAFLASSLRYMHTGNSGSGTGGGGAGPLTPVSDSDRLGEKYSPWAFRDEGSDRVEPVDRSKKIMPYRPPPEDTEILLKTYWSSIHPVSPLPKSHRRTSGVPNPRIDLLSVRVSIGLFCTSPHLMPYRSSGSMMRSRQPCYTRCTRLLLG